MAFSTDVLPNLVDWANMADPDGNIADIAWTLAQANDILKDMVDRVGDRIMKREAVEVPYLVGTMIELPRAALTADQIADAAEFFSASRLSGSIRCSLPISRIFSRWA